jgi:uncharacterized phage-associated protein
MALMVSVYDVAAFILARLGQVGTMKLQKLVYYSQAWSLVWDSSPLFSEKIEAWDKGPVVRELYGQHARTPFIERIDRGDTSKLSDDQRATISAVLAFYAKRTEWWLSELTHREPPWLDARARTDGARNPVITPVAMREFFSTYSTPFRHISDSIARGLDLVVGLPKDAVKEALEGPATEVDGVEEWLETGEGDPWQTSAPPDRDGHASYRFVEK